MLLKVAQTRNPHFAVFNALNPDCVAQLIFNLLPNHEKLMLCIDRTNWKFGQQNINIFMLGITYEGVAFPLLFSMLDKQGNSNSSERIALLNRFIRLFGKDCIDALVADREFVGEQWINFLNIESNHLQNIERIQKLVLLIMIAFLWCYKVGVCRHKAIPISTKKHERKAKNIFKYGLDYY